MSHWTQRSPRGRCAFARPRAVSTPVTELIRFVAAPDGTIVADLAAKLPGRGVWLTCDKAIVAAAAKSAFSPRSLKRAVKACGDLADQVEAASARPGPECPVHRQQGRAGHDGICPGRGVGRKRRSHGACPRLPMPRKAAATSSTASLRPYCREKAVEPRILALLTIEQMSLAMGRANVVHAALKHGGAAEKFLSEAGRLVRFRSGSAASNDTPMPVQNKV